MRIKKEGKIKVEGIAFLQVRFNGKIAVQKCLISNIQEVKIFAQLNG